MASRLVRATISEDEHHALRVVAVTVRRPLEQLVADALRRDRVLRQAFQPKEDGK